MRTLEAQSGAAPEHTRLRVLRNGDRAQTLARLAAATQVEEPAKSIAYGAEALQLLAAVPETRATAPTRVATHNVMASAYTTLGQYDSAGAAAEAGRRLAERTGDRAGMAHALSSLGALAQRRGVPAQAVAYLSEALEIQRALGADSAVAVSLNRLGFVYASDYADYGRSLAYQLESLQIQERLGGPPEALGSAIHNVGVVLHRMRQEDRALSLYRRALGLYRHAGANSRAAATLSNIGDVLLQQGDHDGALAHHRESLALREVVGDRWSLSLARRNIGLTYLAMGRHEDAAGELAVALQLGGPTGNRGLAVRNQLALATVERTRGRSAAAEVAAGEALSIASAMGSRALMLLAWEAQADAQQAAGRHADALASYRSFKSLSDSIFDETTSRQVAALEEQFERERREHEIEGLTNAQAISAMQTRQRTTQRNAIAGAAILLGVVGIAAYRRRTRAASRAEVLSLTDPLTGVHNRRYIPQILGREMTGDAGRVCVAESPRVASTAGGSIAFLMLDIDHFKRVNDTFGHVAGDRLLVDLARLIERTGGPSDAVVRWGGEEFLVVCRGADQARASDLAERIRSAVAAHTTTLDDGRSLRVTCSIGFAVVPISNDGCVWSWEAMVTLADHGTYAAKEQGRDAWVGYSIWHGEDSPAPQPLSPDLIERWVTAGQFHRHRSTDVPARIVA